MSSPSCPEWLASDPLIPRLRGMAIDEMANICERAAILEYEGGVDRQKAEAMAMGVYSD